MIYDKRINKHCKQWSSESTEEKRPTYVHGTTTVVLDDLVTGLVGTATDDPGVITGLIVLLHRGVSYLTTRMLIHASRYSQLRWHLRKHPRTRRTPGCKVHHSERPLFGSCQ